MLASGNSSTSLDLSNLIRAMEQLLDGVNERTGAAKVTATMLPDSTHAEAAKDVVRSFQRTPTSPPPGSPSPTRCLQAKMANLGMLKWEAEQPLDPEQVEMMEVKVANEL